MQYKYKKGDKVLVVSAPGREDWIGKVLTLSSHDSGGDGWDVPAWSVKEPDCHYRFRESELGPIGPGVTETVTKTRIVPGTYGRIHVHLGESNPANTYVSITNINGKSYGGQLLNADELDAAAAVLSALAKGLRDA